MKIFEIITLRININLNNYFTFCLHSALYLQSLLSQSKYMFGAHCQSQIRVVEVLSRRETASGFVDFGMTLLRRGCGVFPVELSNGA